MVPIGNCPPDHDPGYAPAVNLVPPSPEEPADQGDVRWLVRMALIFYGIVALFALGYALFSGSIGSLFGEKMPNVGNLLGGIGVGVAIVALTRVGVRTWPAIERAAREFSQMLGPLRRGDAVILAVLSGFAEELLFRGALWSSLGLLGTTCLFALVHVIPKRALWGYPLFALLAGLLLGLLREGTGSVIPPMLAHIVVNAINLHWIGARHAEWSAPADNGAPNPAASNSAASNSADADGAPEPPGGA